jgi:spore coat polysaccharide biosynthesis protein SpsF
MNVVAIIQARMTSTRLPGKVMLPLGDSTVLGQVLKRCAQINGVSQVCCAIPEGSEHLLLVSEVQKYGATLFRGSENDVLERYYYAAKATKADVIMRITSDCPLIQPAICSQVLDLYLASNVDYACNNMPPTWPHGYDCEVFNFEILEKCHKEAVHNDEREHVTKWMRSRASVANFPNPNGNQYSTRITLDTLEDYKIIKNIYDNSVYIESI